MTDELIRGKAGHRGQAPVRCAHGDPTSVRMQYNLSHQPTVKMGMANTGDNLFTGVAVHDSAEPSILFPHGTTDPQTRRQATSRLDSDMWEAFGLVGSTTRSVSKMVMQVATRLG